MFAQCMCLGCTVQVVLAAVDAYSLAPDNMVQLSCCSNMTRDSSECLPGTPFGIHSDALVAAATARDSIEPPSHKQQHCRCSCINFTAMLA
jgi:hypothetical protein